MLAGTIKHLISFFFLNLYPERNAPDIEIFLIKLRKYKYKKRKNRFKIISRMNILCVHHISIVS